MSIQVHGYEYRTAVAVASRLADLSAMDHSIGESDGRATERNAIFDALESKLAEMGSRYPERALAMMFQNVGYVAEHGAPILSLEEELTIAVGNTNSGRVPVR